MGFVSPVCCRHRLRTAGGCKARWVIVIGYSLTPPSNTPNTIRPSILLPAPAHQARMAARRVLARAAALGRRRQHSSSSPAPAASSSGAAHDGGGAGGGGKRRPLLPDDKRTLADFVAAGSTPKYVRRDGCFVNRCASCMYPESVERILHVATGHTPRPPPMRGRSRSCWRTRRKRWTSSCSRRRRAPLQSRATGAR